MNKFALTLDRTTHSVVLDVEKDGTTKPVVSYVGTAEGTTNSFFSPEGSVFLVLTSKEATVEIDGPDNNGINAALDREWGENGFGATVLEALDKLFFEAVFKADMMGVPRITVKNYDDAVAEAA
jgi:hypothetical protein